MALLTMREYADIDSIEEYGYPVVYCNHCGQPCSADHDMNPHDDTKLYAQVCREFGVPEEWHRYTQWRCRFCPQTSILADELGDLHYDN